jgi:hypothetical protein
MHKARVAVIRAIDSGALNPDADEGDALLAAFGEVLEALEFTTQVSTELRLRVVELEGKLEEYRARSRANAATR